MSVACSSQECNKDVKVQDNKGDYCAGSFSGDHRRCRVEFVQRLEQKKGKMFSEVGTGHQDPLGALKAGGRECVC